MLDTAAKFHSYSLGNLLLIGAQAPQATRVAGFRTWQSLGRQVRKGERGIAILAPCTYRPKTAERPEPGAPAGQEPTTTCSGGVASDAGGKQQVRGFRVVHVFDPLSRDCYPRSVVYRIDECTPDCPRSKALTEEQDRQAGEFAGSTLAIVFGWVEGPGSCLSVACVQDQVAVAEFAGAGFQGLQDAPTESLSLQFDRHSHPFEFCCALIDLS